VFQRSNEVCALFFAAIWLLGPSFWNRNIVLFLYFCYNTQVDP
jgi:hypothetical protein